MKSIATLFALLALAAADPGDPCDDGRSGTCELISDCTAQGRYTVSNLCTSGADATRSDVKCCLPLPHPCDPHNGEEVAGECMPRTQCGDLNRQFVESLCPQDGPAIACCIEDGESLPVVLPPETNAARSLDPLYYWPPQPANRHFRYEITMEMIAQAREYAGYGNSNWGMGLSWIPWLNLALERYELNRNYKRVIMFMAETSHETGGYATFVEVGCNGNYNGGCNYKGRGAVQVTHRYQYQLMSHAPPFERLGYNFDNNPSLMAKAECAWEASAIFFKSHALHGKADRTSFEGLADAARQQINRNEQNRVSKTRKWYDAWARVIDEQAELEVPASQGGDDDPNTCLVFSPMTYSATRGSYRESTGHHGVCVSSSKCSELGGRQYGGFCKNDGAERCCVHTAHERFPPTDTLEETLSQPATLAASNARLADQAAAAEDEGGIDSTLLALLIVGGVLLCCCGVLAVGACVVVAWRRRNKMPVHAVHDKRESSERVYTSNRYGGRTSGVHRSNSRPQFSPAVSRHNLRAGYQQTTVHAGTRSARRTRAPTNIANPVFI